VEPLYDITGVVVERRPQACGGYGRDSSSNLQVPRKGIEG
jgi:hypothetical protein